MKRFIQILSAAIVSSSMMVGVAGATASCPDSTIDTTGQGSTNTITCKTTEDTHVTCVNDVYVVGKNGQVASTGTGSSGSNTTGGVVVTGDATNDNNATVQVGASCGTQVATTTPATPAAGGQGAGTSTPAAAAPAAAAPASANVASLPDTGSNTVLDATVAGVAVIGGAMAVSQLGVSAYRRFALK